MLRWLNNVLASERTAEPGAVPDAHVDEWLREAYALHEAGNLFAAEEAYRRVLRARPAHPDALYLLGELCSRAGRHAQAIELLQKAVAANPGVPLFHHELGTALQAHGELERAQASFSRALELEPTSLKGHLDLGLVLLEQRKFAEAQATYRRALELDACSVVAHVNLGSALQGLEQLEAAAQCFEHALRLDPLCAQALSNLASIWVAHGRHAEAKPQLERALEIDPLLIEARVNLGTVLLKEGRWDEALAIFEEAVRSRPGLAQVHYNLGSVYQHLDRFDDARAAFLNALEIDSTLADPHLELGRLHHERGDLASALAHYEAAVGLRPDLAITHQRYGHALDTMGRLDEALARYDRALELDPGLVQAHVNRASLWLVREDFVQGWQEYEWRLRDPALRRFYERFPLPRWDGSPLSGKSIVIQAEQGLGDEVMYASCFNDVVAHAGQVFIDCDPRLEALFRRSFPRATVHGASQGEKPSWLTAALPIDFKVPAGSLPLYLRRSAAAFPRHQGYLRAAPERVQHWQDRLAALGDGRKLGLSWRGGVAGTGRTWRSLELEQLLPVLRQPGVQWVSLQYGDCAAELAQFKRRHGIEIHHWQEAIDDCDETAALLCALELTLSVCTAVVHLGGALGRPTWVMAPRRPEARYGFSGETMRWYPSARIFRQRSFGDWSSVVEEVCAAMRIAT